jgi:hypothetical protein
VEIVDCWRSNKERELLHVPIFRKLRMATYTGRPFGSREFIERLELAAGRTLAPQKRGRKPKNPKDEANVCDMFDELEN